MSHPLYLEQVKQFKFMTSKVLARIFHFAVNGDVAAAKLYFSVMGNLNNGQSSNNTLIQNQNNFIQISPEETHPCEGWASSTVHPFNG